MDIYNDLEQGTPEWFEVRKGLPTTSMFSAVMAKGRGSSPSKTRKTYMHKLAGEIITGQMTENFSTPAMERGHVMEEEARKLYSLLTDNVVNEVGFIRNGDQGASPDGIIDENGMLEIKSKAPHILIDVLLSDEMPLEHKPQVQGQLMVAEREWCDFMAYYTGMPPMIKRIYRDEAYIKDLKIELIMFNSQLCELVEKIKGM